jgi:hypothetical protein
MLVFDYMIRLYNQDDSVRAALAPAELAVDWRGSVVDSTAAESATEWSSSTVDLTAVGWAHSWRGRTSWITVGNYLSSTKVKVADAVAERHNECWWGQMTKVYPSLDTKVNMRLSRVFGLAVQQRVSLTLQGFDELTENEKGELFKNSIQAYVQYPEELKQKGKKVAVKIISHAWKSYKSKLMKIWRD